MRPRNVLTQTNNMRKLMGLPLLNEDTGATVEDVKKKVLTEDRSFSLGFANNGGLTIAEEEVTEQIEIPEGIENIEEIVMGCIGENTTLQDIQSIPEACLKLILDKDATKLMACGMAIDYDSAKVLMDKVEPISKCVAAKVGVSPLGETTEAEETEEDGEGGLGLNTDAQVFAEQEEKFKFYDPSTEEHEYWDDLADTDEESAYYDWFEDNEDRLYSARNIDNAGGYVVTNGADWDYFKTEWYNSDNYEKYIKTIERRQEKDNKKQGRKDSRDLNKKVRQGYKEKRKKEREERRGRKEGDAEVDYWGVEVDAGINEGGLGLNTDAQVFAEQGALDDNKEYEVKDKSGEVVGTYKSNRKPFAFRANPGTPYKNGDKIPEGLSMDTGWENWDYEKHKFKDKEEVDPHHPEPHRIKETTGGSFAKYNITLED